MEAAQLCADLRCIRLRLACCALMAALAAGAALAAHWRLLEASGARELGERELLAAQQRLLGMEVEHGRYLARLERYRGAASGRSSADEPRLEWLTQLRRAAARRHVRALECEFAAQAGRGPEARRAPELRASRMRLRMDLLHEEDLLGLLADLRARPGTLLRVNACSIERIPARDSEAMTATLRIECSIDWISVREAT